VGLDFLLGLSELTLRQVVILCEFNRRFQPEFGFTVCTGNMHMHPRLFAGEEMES
jgi:hypothetical protein